MLRRKVRTGEASPLGSDNLVPFLQPRGDLGVFYPVERDNYGHPYDIKTIGFLSELSGVDAKQLRTLLTNPPKPSETTPFEPKSVSGISIGEMLSSPYLAIYRMATSDGKIELDGPKQGRFWSLQCDGVIHHTGAGENRQLLRAFIPRHELGEYVDSYTAYGSALKLKRDPLGVQVYSDADRGRDFIMPYNRSRFFNDDIRLFDVGRPNNQSDYTPFGSERFQFMEEFIEHGIAFYAQTNKMQMKNGEQIGETAHAEFERVQRLMRERGVRQLQSGAANDYTMQNLRSRFSFITQEK